MSSAKAPKKSAKPKKKTPQPKQQKAAFLNKIPGVRRFREWRSSKPLYLRILITIGLVILGLFIAHNTIERLWRPIKNPNYGVSFSVKYSEELGLNWRENYLAVINELGFDKLRLMSYWDIGEPKNDEFNYADLDWQMDEAAKNGLKVSLAIGLRQPRWPECHQPNWARELGNNTRAWQDELNEYIVTTMNRYKNHPALESYQLENEAVNNWFGECVGAAPRERLIEEFNLAKATDPNHPVYMSLSDQHGFPLRDPVPDAYGFSVYRTVWNDKTPIPFYLTYPTPIWYHKIRKFLVETIKDRPVFVHELQVEPWGPQATRELSIAEQNKSMDLRQMHRNFDFARKIGTDNIYTWGAEWWYWRKVTFGDNGPWEVVRNETQK
jgi:hypothetical protein